MVKKKIKIKSMKLSIILSIIFSISIIILILIFTIDSRTYNYLSNTKIQLADITILSNVNGSYIVENESIVNIGSTDIHLLDEQYGSFEIVENDFGENILRFIPVDPFNTDYDLKIIRQTFNTL